MFRKYFPSELGGIHRVWDLWDGGASSCGFHHGVTEINWQEMVTMSKVRESVTENCNSCPGRQTTSRTQWWKVPLSSPSRLHPGLAQTDSCPSELRSSVFPTLAAFEEGVTMKHFPNGMLTHSTFLEGSCVGPSTPQIPHEWTPSSSERNYFLNITNVYGLWCHYSLNSMALQLLKLHSQISQHCMQSRDDKVHRRVYRSYKECHFI